jgi:hypothetical protein
VAPTPPTAEWATVNPTSASLVAATRPVATEHAAPTTAIRCVAVAGSDRAAQIMGTVGPARTTAAAETAIAGRAIQGP